MSKRTIFIATENKKAAEFLTEYFSDTHSIPAVIRSRHSFSESLIGDSCLVFFETDWMEDRLASKLTSLKPKISKTKWVGLGKPKTPNFTWDVTLDFPIDEKQFQRALFSQIQFTPKLKLVVVDDEADIGEMIKDYFENRKDPEFEVKTAYNGLEGFKLITDYQPDCIILDIKMPVRTGVELYQDLVKSGRKIPTIVFIDSTAAEEVLEIRKHGNPAFVEKGGHHSSMTEMLSLVKKQIAFS